MSFEAYGSTSSGNSPTQSKTRTVVVSCAAALFLFVLQVFTVPANAASDPIDLGTDLRIDVSVDLTWVAGIEFVDDLDKLALIGDNELRLLNPDGSFHARIELEGNPRVLAVDGTEAAVSTTNPDKIILLDLANLSAIAEFDFSPLGLTGLGPSHLAVSQRMVFYSYGTPDSPLVGWLDGNSGEIDPHVYDAPFYIASLSALPHDRDSFLVSSFGVHRVDRLSGAVLATTESQIEFANSSRVLDDDGTGIWIQQGWDLIELDTTSMLPTGHIVPAPRTPDMASLSAANSGLMVAGGANAIFAVRHGGQWRVLDLRHESQLQDLAASPNHLYALFSVFANHYHEQIPNTVTLSVIDPDYAAADPWFGVILDAHGTPTAATQTFRIDANYQGQPSEASGLSLSYGSLAHRSFREPLNVTLTRTGGPDHPFEEAPRGTYFYDPTHHQWWQTSTARFEVAYRQSANVIDYYPSAYTDLDLFIAEQYNLVLRRQPTDAEMNYWIQELVQSKAYASVAATLVRESEYQAGPQAVSRLYDAYFKRWPDEGGHRYWIGLRHQGLTLEQISYYFADSPEFVNTYGQLNNRHFVELVYQNVMGRLGDEDGMAYWTSILDRQVLDRGGMMVQFSESPEFRNGMDGPITINDLVTGELGLKQTSIDATSWIHTYNAGGDLRPIVDELLRSGAYFNKFWFDPAAGAQLVQGQSRLSEVNDQPSYGSSSDLLEPSWYPVIERQ